MKNCENSDFFNMFIVFSNPGYNEERWKDFCLLLKGVSTCNVINEHRIKKPYSAYVAVLEEEAVAIWIGLARKS